MLGTLRRDTPCELALRSAVHRLGLRYRVDWPLPGTRRRADLAFTSAKVAVFVDGCFWHACPTVPQPVACSAHITPHYTAMRDLLNRYRTILGISSAGR
jgi:DNA mismatch endonuclease Vsr